MTISEKSTSINATSSYMLPLIIVTLVMAAAPRAEAQVRTWNTGDGLWRIDTNWTPNDVPATAGESAVIGGAGPLAITADTPLPIITLDSFSMTNADAMTQVHGGVTFNIGGTTFSNSGDFRLNTNSSGADAILNFTSSLNCTGGGFITLLGNGDDSRISTAPGQTITNAAGHTIRGRGNIHASLINEGIIDGDILSGTLTLLSEPKTNHNIMRATVGALGLSGVTVIQNASGRIIGDNNTVNVLAGASRIENGTIESTGTGRLFLSSVASVLTLRDVTNAADVQLIGGSILNVEGTGLINNGLIRVNSNTSTADAIVTFLESGSLDGAGTLTLEGAFADAQLNTAIGQSITHAAGHTINGRGQINATVVNNGTIRATETNQVMQLLTNNKVNNNLMESVNDARLQLQGITIAQSPAGRIRADGGRVEFNPGIVTVTNGRLETANGGLLFMLSSGAVAILQDVIVDGEFDVNGGCEIHVQGSALTNNGNIRLNSNTSSANSILRYPVSAALNGTGTIHMQSGSDNAQINTDIGAVLTHAAGHTIRGVGQINAAIVNDGIVRTDLVNQILLLQNEDKVNNNLIESTNSARLQFLNIDVTQGPVGRIRADNGAVDFLAGTNRVFGGTLESANGGTVATTTPTSVLVLDDVQNDSVLLATGGSRLHIQGSGLLNNGTITLNNNSSSANSELTYLVSGLLDGPGRVIMQTGSDNSQINTQPGAVITHTADHTISGHGQINAQLINQGLIVADRSASPLTLQGSPKINESLITTTGNGMLTINAAEITQSGNGRIVADDGEVRFSGTSHITGGTLDSLRDGFHRLLSPAILRLTDATNNAEMRLFGGSKLEIDGNGIVNNGQIIVNPNTSSADAIVTFLSSGSLTGSGRIEMRTGAADSQLNAAPGITIVNGSNHTISGRGQINAAMINEGTIRGNFGGDGIDLTTEPKTNNGRMIGSNGGRIEVSVTVDGSGDWIGDSGEIHSLAGGQIDTTGTVRMKGDTLRPNGGGVKAARILLSGTASLDVDNAIVEVTHQLDFRMTTESSWSWNAASDLVLSGGSDATSCNSSLWTTLEVGSTDNGTVGNGTNNFGVADLIVADGAIASLIDVRDNGNRGGGSEALYATSLTLGTGATLNLNGLKLYAGGIDIVPGTLGGGTVIDTPVFLAGDINDDDEVDGDDVQGFVNVLFGTDTTPSHICAADFNNDGFVNAADAAIFSNLLLNP